AEAGLFGVVDGADIHSLALLDVTIISGEQAGALAGVQYGGHISNVQATGNVEGLVAGGLIGTTSGTALDNVFTQTSVNGMLTAGGLLGMSMDTSIANAYASGSVTSLMANGGLI